MDATNFFVCNNLQLYVRFANVCRSRSFVWFHRYSASLLFGKVWLVANNG